MSPGSLGPGTGNDARRPPAIVLSSEDRTTGWGQWCLLLQRRTVRGDLRREKHAAYSIFTYARCAMLHHTMFATPYSRVREVWRLARHLFVSNAHAQA